VPVVIFRQGVPKGSYDGGFAQEIASDIKVMDLGDDETFFEKNLFRFGKQLSLRQCRKLRKLVPVNTICMHGSPRSKWDSKDLWKKYDYKELGIIGEPYFDLDFNEIFYLTDTGRRWDGWRVSIRDKVPQQEEWVKQGLVFHSTSDIIKAANADTLPKKIMMTFHPQRWNDKPLPWLKELVWQGVKNQGKRILVKQKTK